MTDIKNKPKLTIEIPEINIEIFEKRIIDGIPTINKGIKCKNAYDFWNELDNDEGFIKKMKVCNPSNLDNKIK